MSRAGFPAEHVADRGSGCRAAKRYPEATQQSSRARVFGAARLACYCQPDAGARAAAMIADEPAGGLPRLVRAMAASSMGLALVAAVVALLPGSADYEDTSRCFAQALGNLGQMEHHPACEPTWRFIGTRPAGGLALATLMSLFVAGLPLLWMRERLRLLLAWSVVVLAAVAAAAIGVVVTFELDFHFNRRTDSLWPARVLPFLVVAAIICALAVLLTCAIGRRRNRRVRA